MLTSTPPDGLAPDIWHQLADHVSQLVWMADGNGWPFWFNRRCSEFTGLPGETLVGVGWHDILHPEDAKRVRGEWSLAVAEARAYEGIYRLRGSDGQYRHFLSRAEPCRDALGNVTYWFGTSTDVTDQVAAERYNAFLVHLEEVLRSAPCVEDAKRQVTKLLGQELKADRVYFATPDVDRGTSHVREEYLAPGVGSLAGTHSFSPEVRAIYSLGEPVVIEDYREHPAWVTDKDRPEIASLPFRAVLDIPLVRNGRLVSVLCVHQTVPRQWTQKEVELVVATAERSWNLVERARAEGALSEANRRFQAVLDNTEMAVFLMDEGQQCVYANAAAEALTGYAFSEMQGRPLHDVIHNKKPDGSHYPLEECPIDRAFPERAKMQGEELFVARDGSFYPVGKTGRYHHRGEEHRC
jgi:PAS domain S-box-containing protein